MEVLLERRNCIPIIYTRGSYYEVGYDIGRTVKSIIHSFVKCCHALNESYIPIYNTSQGKELYNQLLKNVENVFPEYIKEIQGISDGAEIPFFKLFLLHVNDILSYAFKNKTDAEVYGCSTVCCNYPGLKILGHTEDTPTEMMQHFYFVSAEIICGDEIVERFTSLCYAGQLPGLTMSFNIHGMISSINFLRPEVFVPLNMPRSFICRALLKAKSTNETTELINKYRSADGFSINFAFLNEKPFCFFNIEVAPAPSEKIQECSVAITTARFEEWIYHTNKRIDVLEIQGSPFESSLDRLEVLGKFNEPKCKDDIKKMLSEPTVFKNPERNSDLNKYNGATIVVDSSATEFEEAIALTREVGYGRYQMYLVFLTYPLGISTILGVSNMGNIMPAAVCSLQVSKFKQGLLSTAIYLGMIPTGPVWGILSDNIGRRKVLFFSALIMGSFELAGAFTSGYWMLFIFKICSGVGNSGITATVFTYLSEFVDAKNKDTMTMRSGAVVTFGMAVVPFIAFWILPYTWSVEYHFLGITYTFEPWRLFLLVSASFPLLGSLIPLLILPETPKFLFLSGKKDEALDLMRRMYAKNTNKPPETFPVKSLYVAELLKDTVVESNKSVGLSQVSLLFRYPYMIPLIVCLLGQAITLSAINAVRPFLPMLFTLALGIGQNKNYTNPEQTEFCVLLMTQRIFQTQVDCVQSEIRLNPKIYVCTFIVGLVIFSSFFVGKLVVNKFGKVTVFVTSHVISACCIAYFPWSTVIVAVAIISVFCTLMQNCLVIVIGLMISRIPTSLRGLSVSLIFAVGRAATLLGIQILPVFSTVSCVAGFLAIAVINLMAIPLVIVYVRQPNPIEEAALKSAQSAVDKQKYESVRGLRQQ